MIAQTPKPPYYAVIFTSERTDGDNGYSKMSEKMMILAAKQDGYLGVESARDAIGITISYWRDLESIKKFDITERRFQVYKTTINGKPDH